MSPVIWAYGNSVIWDIQMNKVGLLRQMDGNPVFLSKNGFPDAILNFQEKQNKSFVYFVYSVIFCNFGDIWTLLLL